MVKKIISIFKDSSNSFHGQNANEPVMLLLRQHPFTIILRLSFLAIIGLVPAVLLTVFEQFLATHNLLEICFFVSTLVYLGLWFLAFYNLTLYTLNTVIITNQRIIDSDQLGYFNQKVSELHMDRVQDVSAHTNGLFETLLKFGEVVVQTAASEKHFTFHQMPHPTEVKDTIMHISASRHSGVMLK